MLKVGSSEEIQKMFAQNKKDIAAIIDSIIELSYYMRGSVSYDSMLTSMSVGERDKLLRFIKTRLEDESKSPHPVY